MNVFASLVNLPITPLPAGGSMWVRRFTHVCCALLCILSFLALFKYPGQGHVYVAFAVIANALLYAGLRKDAIYFDTFIGIFFWLGFWLKLTIKIAFLGGHFYEPVGSFDGTGPAFDRALWVSSCGFLGLLVARLLRARYAFTYPEKPRGLALAGLVRAYCDYRTMILPGFLFLIATVTASNFYFVIYQRGAIPQTVLPYGLNGIYSWLLLYGMSSMSATILHCELMRSGKPSYLTVMISLVGEFLANISLLSRGMILNASALLYGLFRSIKQHAVVSKLLFWATSVLMAGVLFATSVLVVEYARSIDPEHSYSPTVVALARGTNVLFLDRWIGIEGVMAVSSYPGQGWDLWREAWKESFSYNRMSFYDETLIVSPYLNTDRTKHHYISLPGVLAFCFYPGSFLFLFACMFLVGTAGAIIEISAFKLSDGNVILCALLTQIAAYRFAHFGYVPGRSYLFYGSLFLTLFLIYAVNKLLLYRDNGKEPGTPHTSPAISCSS